MSARGLSEDFLCGPVVKNLPSNARGVGFTRELRSQRGHRATKPTWHNYRMSVHSNEEPAQVKLKKQKQKNTF